MFFRYVIGIAPKDYK